MPDRIARTQLLRLDSLLGVIRGGNEFYRRKLAFSGDAALRAGPGGEGLASRVRDALARGNFESSAPGGAASTLRALLDEIPFTTKDELAADQEARPPYGTNLSFERGRYSRLHRTSGTSGRSLAWLDTAESWRWFVDCWSLVWRGAGLRPDDRVFFPFSFGPFIGFWGAFESARELGAFVLPAGGLASSARVAYLLEHEISVVACTPTYALHLAEVAAAAGADLAASAVRLLVVAGEPGGSIPATRARIEEAWGARVVDHHGMTEIGCVSYEPVERPGGLCILETEFIPEVVEPGGSARTADGEIGELVLTNLGRVGSPLLRYRTGDLVRWVAGEFTSAADSGDGRLKHSGWLEGGILSRADDMLHIRGNNVYPGAVESVLREFREVAEFRLCVIPAGEMSALRVEIEPDPAAFPGGLDIASDAPNDDDERRAGGPGASPSRAFAARIERALHDRLLFRPEVRLVPPGALPRYELKARRVVRVAADRSDASTGSRGSSVPPPGGDEASRVGRGTG